MSGFQKAPLLTKEGWQTLRLTGWFSVSRILLTSLSENHLPATAVPLLRKEESKEVDVTDSENSADSVDEVSSSRCEDLFEAMLAD